MVLRCVFLGHEFKSLIEPDPGEKDLKAEERMEWALLCIKCGRLRRVTLIYKDPNQ